MTKVSDVFKKQIERCFIPRSLIYFVKSNTGVSDVQYIDFWKVDSLFVDYDYKEKDQIYSIPVFRTKDYTEWLITKSRLVTFLEERLNEIKGEMNELARSW